MKIALIANPIGGGGNVPRLVHESLEALENSGFGVDLFLTGHPGHAREIAGALEIEAYDGIVSAGGDGTNYEVLNGLLSRHGDRELPFLGLLPTGRGNSFARDLDILSVEDGIAAICRGRTRNVDVCRFTQGEELYFFVNLMGFGFVTDAAKTAARFRRAGDLSYVIGVFHRTVRLKFHRIEMEIDGVEIREENCFVEICNSRYTGGKMLMAPDARLDDGLFDVVIAKPLSRMSLLATFPKIYGGTHPSHPGVRILRGRSATIRTDPVKALLPDGEIFGHTPTHIDILPGRVRYFS
jgi:diacylglycerol kinase (ATP)